MMRYYELVFWQVGSFIIIKCKLKLYQQICHHYRLMISTLRTSRGIRGRSFWPRSR